MEISQELYDQMVFTENQLRDSLNEANEECERLKQRLAEEEKDRQYYRWHDSLRDPKDLPEVHQLPGSPDIILSNVVNALYDREGWPTIVTALYLNGRFVYSGLPDEGWVTEDIEDVVAWQYIRIPETEYTEVKTDEHEGNA